MNPLLLVMNPRDIRECVHSIERLPADQAWMTAYTEPQLVPVIADIIATTDYTHYLICSDDGVIPEFALEAVLDALDDGHPVATGYSNLDETNMHVNLTRTPFVSKRESVASDYDLYHLADVLGWPEPLVPTCFAGFALTGMSREMWLEFPYLARGAPTDWDLSCRLQEADIPIVAPKQAFMWHVKELVNHPDQEQRKRLLIGEVEPNVKLVAGVA